MSGLRDLPAGVMRSALIGLSHRRRLGSIATRMPVTRAMVARFVAGESLPDVLQALARLKAAGFATTVDVLGESVAQMDAALAAADRYIELLDALQAKGLEPNVSLKLTQMGLDIDRSACEANLGRVFTRAAEVGAFVRVDMEDHTRTDATLDVWRAVRHLNPASGVVIQASLGRSAADVEQLVAEGAPVRLCKGAYLEPASLSFRDKADVDRSYVALMERLLRGEAPVALATHDPRIIDRAVTFAREQGIARDHFEFQMLFGIRRDLQARLLEAGYGVRVYVPFGTEWYPYFMRRLAERPANVAFILRSLLREGQGGSDGHGSSQDGSSQT